MDISPHMPLMSPEGKVPRYYRPSFREAQMPGCRIDVTPDVLKILRCPLAYYITSCLAVGLLVLDKDFYSCRKEK